MQMIRGFIGFSFAVFERFSMKIFTIKHAGVNDIQDVGVYQNKARRSESYVWIIDTNGELLSRTGESHEVEFGEQDWSNIWRGRWYPATNTVHIYLPYNSKAVQDFYKSRTPYGIADVPYNVLYAIDKVYGDSHNIKVHAKENSDIRKS